MDVLKAGTRVSAVRRWGYGSETVVGLLDKDFKGGYDGDPLVTIWCENKNYKAVIIDHRHWDIEEKPRG